MGYTLEHRVYNTLAFSIIIVSFLAAFLNSFFGIHWMTTVLGFSGCVVAIALFYLSRFKGLFNRSSIYVMMAVGAVIMGFIYPFDGGSTGPWIFIVLNLVIVFVVISPNQSQLFIVAAWLMYVVSFYVIEYLNEDWVMHYSSRGGRMSDMIATFAYAFVLMAITIIAFKRNYNKERETVRLQNEELSRKNRQIEILMKELNHRVKNNLQVVTSLLNLQSARIKDADARNAVLDGRNRLISMVLIHQKLYQNERPTEIDMKEYLVELSNNIVVTNRSETRKDLLTLEIEPVVFKVEHAVPVGLIVNELVTNAVKHAFVPETDADRIRIRFYQLGNRFGLIVSDNGKGFSGAIGDSFGLPLVRSLVDQLEGTMNVGSAVKGTTVTIEFGFSNE
jgi:two-component sensor histidine kinase